MLLFPNFTNLDPVFENFLSFDELDLGDNVMQCSSIIVFSKILDFSKGYFYL